MSITKMQGEKSISNIPTATLQGRVLLAADGWATEHSRRLDILLCPSLNKDLSGFQHGRFWVFSPANVSML